MRKPALPFLLMGPDIYGPALYSRHRTLAAAERQAAWQGGKTWRRSLTIARVVSQGSDLNGEQRRRHKREDAEREALSKRIATASAARSAPTRKGLGL